MASYLDSLRGLNPPILEESPEQAGIQKPIILTSSGTTEVVSPKLRPGKVYELTVTGTDVVIGMRSETGLSSVVDPSSLHGGMPVSVGSSFRFRVSRSAQYLYVEALDGTSTFVVGLLHRD